MPQIDVLLAQMQKSGAQGAALRGDAPLQLQLPSGATPGATLTQSRVEEILREILPPELQTALQNGGTAQFDYASPLGLCRVRAAQSEGVTSFEIVPNFAPVMAPPATPNFDPMGAPPMVASPITVSPTAAPFTGTQPMAMSPIPNNDSGQSSATLPPELRGFNWGGLLLSWVWAIGNKSWIGLLGLVPIVGFFVRFFLGFRGNQMAWRGRRWDSAEQFRATQRTWTVAGLCIFLVGGLLYIPIMAAILFPVFARARENARRSAYQSNMKQIALGAFQYSQAKGGKFPTGITMASWEKSLHSFVRNEKFYHCPNAKAGEESYLLNPKMAGVNPDNLSNAWRTPLFYDADFRHLDGVNVAFADGHIMWYKTEIFESQILPDLVK